LEPRFAVNAQALANRHLKSQTLQPRHFQRARLLQFFVQRAGRTLCGRKAESFHVGGTFTEVSAERCKQWRVEAVLSKDNTQHCALAARTLLHFNELVEAAQCSCERGVLHRALCGMGKADQRSYVACEASTGLDVGDRKRVDLRT